jgi:bifunctional non-homologous end joining protein LigD
MPLAWNELSPSVSPDAWTIKTVPRRLASLRSDPWKAYWTSKQRIPRNAVRALEAM